jgi:hypothetical protein
MIQRTENPDYGFYGTMQSAGHNPDVAWSIALPIVAAFWPVAHPRFAEKRARHFLDSAGGRHLADAVAHHAELKPALQAALPSFHGWLQ